jgi:hypothetical protein
MALQGQSCLYLSNTNPTVLVAHCQSSQLDGFIFISVLDILDCYLLFSILLLLFINCYGLCLILCFVSIHYASWQSFDIQRFPMDQLSGMVVE